MTTGNRRPTAAVNATIDDRIALTDRAGLDLHTQLRLAPDHALGAYQAACVLARVLQEADTDLLPVPDHMRTWPAELLGWAQQLADITPAASPS